MLCVQSCAIASRENSELENEGLFLCARNCVSSTKKKSHIYIPISNTGMDMTKIAKYKHVQIENFLVQHKVF